MQLKTEKITKIEHIPYEGDVYNVTTETGNVIVNNILAKNSGGLGTPAYERVSPGMIHKANGGVLFIDEVGTLDPKTQQDLLTAMQEKKYPITGQSERSSGAMVRTSEVPCLAAQTEVWVNGNPTKIDEHVNMLFKKNKPLQLSNGSQVLAIGKNKDRVRAYNEEGLQTDVPLLWYKTPYHGEIVELELEDGTKIEVTPNHPIATTRGLINAGELNSGSEVIINDKNEKNVLINEVDIIETYSEDQKKRAYAYLAYCKFNKNMHKDDLAKLLGVDESTIRNWKKGCKPRAIKAIESLTDRRLCPLIKDDKRIKTIAKVTGVLFGDGGTTRNRVHFATGLTAKEDLEEFKQDIIEIFGREKNITVRNTGRGYETSFNSAHAARFFQALGVPKGDKVAQAFTVPKWIYTHPTIEKAFFSALISAELSGDIDSISRTPRFTLAKIAKFEKQHLAFLDEIKKFLKKQGIACEKTKLTKVYFKQVNGKKIKTAAYNIVVASSHKELLILLDTIDIVYASHKKDALERVAKRSKEYLQRQKELKEAYELIPLLREQKLTIKKIAKKLGLEKNSVLKRVVPTYQKYTKAFREKVVQHARYLMVEDISHLYNVPIPTIKYWMKNENK